jgi:hypothetical protein
MHVWQAFQVPEADDAFGKVEQFLEAEGLLSRMGELNSPN